MQTRQWKWGGGISGLWVCASGALASEDIRELEDEGWLWGGGFLSQQTLFSIWSQVRANPKLRFSPTADALCHCKCDRSQGPVVQFNLCGVMPLQFAL